MPDPELTQDDISRLVFTDDLTGIYNRRYLYRYLSDDVEWESEEQAPFSLIMLDLDSFKTVNDTYGHLEGDRTLKQTADVLRNSFRDNDIVARYAGDEFSIILPDTARDEAVKLAETARLNLQKEKFTYGEGKVKGAVSLSAGVAAFPDDALSAEELIDKADKALYLSKTEGRNRVSDTAAVERQEAPPPVKVLPRKVNRSGQKQIENMVKLTGGITEGDNRFVLIRVPSGAGKIHFLGELMRNVESGGAKCIVESCDENYSGSPYHPLTDLIDRSLHRDTSQIRRIKNTLSYDELAVLSREIPVLAQIVENTSAVDKLTPLVRRFMMFDGLTHILAALSQERVLCIVLDDFQLIDEGTLNVILSCLKSPAGRVVLCGVLQLEPGSDGEIEDPVIDRLIDEVRAMGRLFEAVIEPFGIKDVSALISELLPDREPSGEFDRLMLEVGKGNPLYIETAIQVLKSKDIIRFEDGKWKIGHVRKEDLPSSFDEMVRDKIATLDEEAEKIISEAAVIGSNFNLSVLRRVSETNEGEVLDILDKARHLGLVESAENLNDDELKFVSSHVRDVTYENVDEEFRRAAHGRVAEVIEDIYKDNPDQAALALAYHYRKAGDEQRAEEYLSLGEERTKRIYDSEEITEHAQGKTVQARVKECIEELSDEQVDAVMQTLQALSRASKSLQMYPQGSQITTQAIDLLQKAVDKVVETIEGFTVGESKEGMLINGNAVDPKAGGMTASEITKAIHDRSIQGFTFTREVGSRELLSFAKLFGMPPVKGVLDRDFWDNKMQEAGITHIGVVQKAYVLDAKKARETGVYKKQLHESLSGEVLLRACAFVRGMNSAVEKMTLYPPGSSLITNAIDQMAKSAEGVLAECNGLSISEVDGNLLINGAQPGAQALTGGAGDFAGVLRKSGIKSCVMDKEVPLDEMRDFLQLLGEVSEPKPIAEWKTSLAEKGITHIRVGETIYTGAVSARPAVRKKSATKPEEKKEEKPAPSGPVEKAKEICSYEPEKLLTGEVISSLPEILEGLVLGRESDVLGTLITKILSILSSEDAAVREKTSKALLDIYQKSSVAVQEVLLLLGRDTVIDSMSSESAGEPYSNMVEFAGQMARRCAEQGDIKNLDRIVCAMRQPVMAEDVEAEMKKTADKVLADLFNSPDFQPLVGKVKAADFEGRKQMLSVLGALGQVGAPPLVDLIKETEDQETRRAAAGALREGGPESVAALSKELTRYAPPDPSCRILSVLPDAGADVAQAVSQTILHPNENVRRESLVLLKGLDRQPAVDMLLGTALGKDAEAAVLAVHALGELGYTEAAKGLCDLLQTPSDPQLQSAVCGALGKIGGEDTLAALKRTAEAKRLLGLRMVFHDEVRVAAASALGHIGGDEANEVLRRLAKDKSEAVRSAAEAVLPK